MRSLKLLLIFLALSVSAFAQPGKGKDKPKIVGQSEVRTNEDQSVTLQLTQLTVRDRDDWFYPFGFTLKAFPGENYTLDGLTVVPKANFSGTLNVRVIVNDGENDSDPFDMKIEVNPVNDRPVITGQQPITTPESQPVLITLSHLQVTDVDNAYPNGFTLSLNPFSTGNYSVSGNEVRPNPGYSGTLSVALQVSDGTEFSDMFSLQIAVTPANQKPEITGQTALTFNEDEAFHINLQDLVVTDADDTYPNGFTLKILPGADYTFNGNLVTPVKDRAGNINVNLSVNDGHSDSDPYPGMVTLKAVNDAPEISKLEIDPLIYTPGKSPVAISEVLEIVDVDNDSLMSAEIGFASQSYVPAFDILNVTGTGAIKGNFDQMKGVIALSGRAKLADYISIIKKITYSFNATPDAFAEGKKFYIKVSDGKLASALATREIRTKQLDVVLDIPSAFTPNGDFSNDTWVIKPLRQTEELTQAVVRVYHRSGRMIYETKGFDKSWDGRVNGEILPADSYFYTIDFGQAFQKSSLKGTVTILR